MLLVPVPWLLATLAEAQLSVISLGALGPTAIPLPSKPSLSLLFLRLWQRKMSLTHSGTESIMGASRPGCHLHTKAIRLKQAEHAHIPELIANIKRMEIVSLWLEIFCAIFIVEVGKTFFLDLHAFSSSLYYDIIEK